MWTTYHNIRVSEEFVPLWQTFLQESGLCPTPIFYQTVTNKLFEKRIQFHCPIAPTGPENQDDGTLTYEEENSIWCVAGYVLRSTRKKNNMNY